MRANVGLFLLLGKNATYRELAENFVNTSNRIFQFVSKNPRPFIAKIYRPSPSKKTPNPLSKKKAGDVKLWLSYNEWKAL